MEIIDDADQWFIVDKRYRERSLELVDEFLGTIEWDQKLEGISFSFENVPISGEEKAQKAEKAEKKEEKEEEAEEPEKAEKGENEEKAEESKSDRAVEKKKKKMYMMRRTRMLNLK